MFCMKCGKELPDDAAFCYACGAKVVIPEKSRLENESDVSAIENTSIDDVHIEPSTGTYEQPEERQENGSDFVPINQAQTTDIKGKQGTKKHILVPIGITVAIIFFTIIVLLFLITKFGKTKAETIPVNTDYKATATFHNSNGKTSVRYFVYDDEGNLEYEYEESIDSDYSEYNLEHYTYLDGNMVVYQYELLGDYSQEIEAMGVEDITISASLICEYDNQGNKIKAQEVGESNHYEYTYNENNQLVKEQYFSNKKGNNYIVIYEYDNNGNKIKETYEYQDAGESVNTYQYDKTGKLIKSLESNLEFEYEYDEEGRLIRKTKGEDYWTYTYLSNPQESMQYLELIGQVFDLSSLEENAKCLLEEYCGGSVPKQNTESKEDTVNDDAVKREEEGIPFIEGGLPESVFERIKGHYVEITGFSIDIESPTSITKSYGSATVGKYREEIICGYYEYQKNGYYIYVKDAESEKSRTAYLYIEEDVPKLYEKNENGWEPIFDDCYYCYSKDEKDHSITKHIDVAALNETLKTKKVTLSDLREQGYTLSLYVDHTSAALPYKLYEIENTGCYAVVYEYCPEYTDSENVVLNVDERVYLIIDSDDIEDSAIYDTYLELMPK